MFKLVIQDDEGKTTVVPLIRDEITIGRKEGNTIRLTERNVSRRHARILRSNNEVQIEDLGSYNGIRVNNARIAERVSLRISDQVQIGDYKLYLKAEGVEQVDDARTMPIERIDNVTTEAMPAVTPTPIAATPSPTARTIGAADTDPAGRPVATAAQITALNPPSGYGKLVVLSSNFAGKEFELTRPQMIVGRTDENDLVVNHRSISRNHAKVTRDTDTQRYTISDLQSSNGVRVNGQDYGKVELRRGDVVDLGHVRLRFVEPGEDFVFARDAVIADVEGTGTKKGMMIAIILAVVVIGAVGAFFLLKKNDSGSTKTNGSNDIGSNGSDQLVGSAGSAGSGQQLVVADPIDAAATPGSNATVPTGDEGAKIAAECDGIAGEHKWDTLKMCADKLKAFDPTKAAELAKRAMAETKFDQKHDEMKQALGEGNLSKARKILADIADTSAYHKDAQDEYDAAEQKAVDDMKGRAQAFSAAGKCKEIDTLITQATAKSTRVGDAVRAYKCAAVAPIPEDCTQTLRNPDSSSCKKQFCATHGDNTRCQATVAPPTCNADALVDTGTQAEGRGDHGSALTSFEAAYRCKKDAHTLAVTFMAACNAQKADSARKYWKVMSPDTQNHLLQICLHNHITKEMLDAQ